MRYFGIDAAQEPLDYTRRKVARPGFSFRLVPGNAIPVADVQADFATFFAVFTHPLHEESYTYLERTRRVPAPGVRVVFSFLEFANPSYRAVFAGDVDRVRKRPCLGHINVSMHQADLRLLGPAPGLRGGGDGLGRRAVRPGDGAHSDGGGAARRVRPRAVLLRAEKPARGGGPPAEVGPW